MAKRITINDVANLLRVSPETIRFYNKKKIISPERDNENSYRYFTQTDIRRLYDCRIYQSMGFSLAEIIEIFREASPQKLDSMIDAKEQELQRIIEEDRQALERIRQVKAANEKAERCYGEFFIKESPHYLAAFHSDHGELDPESIQHRFWKCVADYYNLFTCAAYIRPELAASPHLGEEMKCGYTIDIELGEKLGLAPGGPIIEFKPRKCVYTTIHAEPIVNAAVLAPALRWIEDRNLTLTGDILCSTIKITFRDGVESRLYEVWLPID